MTLFRSGAGSASVLLFNVHGGKAIYEAACAACHGTKGQRTPKPLAGPCWGGARECLVHEHAGSDCSNRPDARTHPSHNPDARANIMRSRGRPMTARRLDQSIQVEYTHVGTSQGSRSRLSTRRSVGCKCCSVNRHDVHLSHQLRDVSASWAARQSALHAAKKGSARCLKYAYLLSISIARYSRDRRDMPLAPACNLSVW